MTLPAQTSSAVGGLKMVGGSVGYRLDIISQMYHSQTFFFCADSPHK